MGAYEFNKATYKAVTVRLNRMKDRDVIKHLGTVHAVNSYIVNLIREDMAKRARANMYEVVEDRGLHKSVVGSCATLQDAIERLYSYVANEYPVGRVYIVQKFTGIQRDGHKVLAGVRCSYEVTAEEKEREEEKNAE